MKRNIIEINEELCNGCGSCVTACAEGALQMVNGKAKLVSDVYCDGLGACLGDCPTGALKVIEREAPAFDEHEVEKHLAKSKAKEMPMACGCPSSSAMVFTPIDIPEENAPARSSLSHFPVKLQLINPASPFLKGADLLLMADCCALCYPALHQKMLKGKAVAMGCPKLDDLKAHIDKLAQVISQGRIRSLTVVHMEVPCCTGFVRAAQVAVQQTDAHIPVRHITISRQGEVLQEGPVNV